MNTQTDFELWLSVNQPSDPDEIYNLYRAVKDEQTVGGWEVTKSNNSICVKGIDGWVAITSKSAKDLFLNLIDNLKGDPSQTMEGWYEFHRSMNKND
jgi:hypothetical protein